MLVNRASNLALVISFATALLVGGGAYAQSGGNFFGFNFWPTQPQPQPPVTRVVRTAYPTFKQYAHRHAHLKIHHHYAHKAPLNPVVQNPVAQNTDTPPAEWSLLAKRLATMQQANPGALSVFLNDYTLQRKDAVMTSSGIFVFNGVSGSYHTPKDFRALAYTKALPHRVELAAIERVSVPHFEVAEPVKLAKTRIFADVRPAAKSFEAAESKAVRHIAGVNWYE